MKDLALAIKLNDQSSHSSWTTTEMEAITVSRPVPIEFVLALNLIALFAAFVAMRITRI